MPKRKAEPAVAPDPPPLRLEWRSPAELAENPRNWRRHGEAQLAALAGVLAEVGWAGACLYNERTGRLIDGHARRALAQQSGADRVPVLVGSWDEAQEAKILATLDPLAAMATADAAALDALLRDVQTGSEAVQAMLTTLAAGVAGNGLPEPGGGGDDFDTTPEAQGPTRTNAGELWAIGGVHRLLVGDCTVAENVARLMGAERADSCIADPPYGMNWSADASRFTGGKFGSHPPARMRADVIGDDQPFDPTPFLAFETVVLWGMNHFCSRLPAGGVLVWIKKPDDRFGTFLSDAEIAWTNKGHGIYAIRHEWSGITRETERGDFLHPTQKPVAVVEWIIEKVEAGPIVYDPFLGSGTTLVAAHRLGRRCHGCEIEPRYADVILKRAEAEGLACEKLS